MLVAANLRCPARFRRYGNIPTGTRPTVRVAVSSQSYHILWFLLFFSHASGDGFEPPQADSKSAGLPLADPEKCAVVLLVSGAYQRTFAGYPPESKLSLLLHQHRVEDGNRTRFALARLGSQPSAYPFGVNHHVCAWKPSGLPSI